MSNWWNWYQQVPTYTSGNTGVHDLEKIEELERYARSLEKLISNLAQRIEVLETERGADDKKEAVDVAGNPANTLQYVDYNQPNARKQFFD